MKKMNYISLMMITSVFFWGSVFPIAKILLIHLSGLSLVISRFGVAVISLGIYMLLKKINFSPLPLYKWFILTLVGIFGVGGFNIMLFTGLQYTSATNGALIMALSPIFTSIINAILNRSWITKKQLLSIAVSLIGVSIVITNGSIISFSQFNLGDLIIITAMLTWSCYTICSQRLSTWLPTIPYTQFTMLMGGLALLFFNIFFSENKYWYELFHLSLYEILGVLYLGLCATVLSYIFWIKGATTLGPDRASIYFNFVPIFAALVSIVFGQRLSLIQLIGMIIVIAGLTLPRTISFFYSKKVPLKINTNI